MKEILNVFIQNKFDYMLQDSRVAAKSSGLSNS